MEQRARLIPINGYTTLIDDAGASSAYLILGRERAVLIDTLNGMEDLADIVRQVTDLPVMVVNTHAHLDHIGGNHFFAEAWLHRADLDMYGRHLAMLQESLRDCGVEPIPDGTECRLRFIEPGTVLDLGGRSLEVVHIPGHSPGSIAMLDRDARLLFTGDAINGQIWMQLNESTMLSEYLAGLQALDRFRSDFDGLYGGHVQQAVATPAAYIDTMKNGVREILEGKTENDDDWPWFQGMARRHMLGKNAWILYTKEKVG